MRGCLQIALKISRFEGLELTTPQAWTQLVCHWSSLPPWCPSFWVSSSAYSCGFGSLSNMEENLKVSSEKAFVGSLKSQVATIQSTWKLVRRCNLGWFEAFRCRILDPIAIFGAIWNLVDNHFWVLEADLSQEASQCRFRERFWVKADTMGAVESETAKKNINVLVCS